MSVLAPRTIAGCAAWLNSTAIATEPPRTAPGSIAAASNGSVHETAVGSVHILSPDAKVPRTTTAKASCAAPL